VYSYDVKNHLKIKQKSCVFHNDTVMTNITDFILHYLSQSFNSFHIPFIQVPTYVIFIHMDVWYFKRLNVRINKNMRNV